MRMLLLALVSAMSMQSRASRRAGPASAGQVISTNADTSASHDIRGTVQVPLVIKTTKTREEIDQEINDRNEKTATDRKLVDFTKQLVALLGIARVGVLHAKSE